ncbi:hypothetical protein REPUB_Repub01dG0266500 [Reevesia pubescens]
MRGGRSKVFDLLGCILRKSDEEAQGFQTKVLKKVVETYGVISVALEGDQKDKVGVIGDGIDATTLTRCLRKKVGHANIESLEEVKEKEKEASPIPISWNSTYNLYI